MSQLDLKSRRFAHFATDLFRYTLGRFRPELDTRHPTYRADAHETRRPWRVLPWANNLLVAFGDFENV